MVVAQDCRGRFDSQGDFYPLINEGLDGYDTIEWAATQPWSNGKIGTFGWSYLARNQYHAAMYRPPHLGAMFALVGGASVFEEHAYPGGAPSVTWRQFILQVAASGPQAERNPAVAESLRQIQKNPAPWLALHPQKRAEIFASLPEYRKIYQDLLDHPQLDAFWKQRGYYTPGYYREIKDVPILFLGGWYDNSYVVDGILRQFSALQRLHKTLKKLIIGPWPHSPIGQAECGDADFGAAAAADRRVLAVDWFDHWLRGRPSRVLGPEAVRLFRMGGGDGSRNAAGRLRHGGEWITAQTWPPRPVQPVKYYLRSGGRLEAALPVTDQPSRLVYDPERPVPTIGGRNASSWMRACAQNQVCSPQILGCEDSLPLNRRRDVLSFQTDPLASPVDVTGSVRAVLWISSDAPDTDFTAKLVDVYPDGYALIITDGQTRARYRKSLEKPELMKPGRVYKLVVEVGSTSNRFAAGHRIRLDISSSNYPRLEPNPNTGEPPNRWTRRVKARSTVYHDRRRPSYLELPQ